MVDLALEQKQSKGFYCTREIEKIDGTNGWCILLQNEEGDILSSFSSYYYYHSIDHLHVDSVFYFQLKVVIYGVFDYLVGVVVEMLVVAVAAETVAVSIALFVVKILVVVAVVTLIALVVAAVFVFVVAVKFVLAVTI